MLHTPFESQQSSVRVREVRSSTVSTTRPSLQSRGIGSARSGRADKKKKEEPAFMKEFQLKKQRSTARGKYIHVLGVAMYVCMDFVCIH